MTDANIIIAMLWGAIGLATAHKATALADWFIAVGAM
jgi:hypothetical protein